ncbi:radical SAM/SPASM domain-containing protein [Roseburia faecis]|uniref:radical SAM/SPASM domain-containing protein n=1 Tax=Roseburia faecis TaxID=301302 RepID=UPI0019222B32|nr:radical SAM protein [Roseburia faecis]
MDTYIIPLEKNKNIVFVPESINYFFADNVTAELVQRLDEGFDSLRSSFPGLNKETYNKLVYEICKENDKHLTSIPEKQLDRLIINISNDCNMRCKYCYANQGTYGQEQNMISSEFLKKTLDTFFSIFESIGLIQLFGGEPTMNIEAIENAGKYLKEHNYTTQLGLVTNASLITDKFIELVRKYDIKVTVSVDVKKVHDSLRPFPKDTPSWELIKNNIHKLQCNTSQPSQIEFTYTGVHEKENISICQVLEELKAEYGDIPVHIAPVCTTDIKYKLQTRNSFIQSVKTIYKEKESGNYLSYSTLKAYELALKHKIPFDYFCGAGISTLAVSTRGDIYPCFYFIDNEKFKIGNVFESKDKIQNQIIEKRNLLYDRPKKKTEKCKNCFVRTVCTGCLGDNYTKTGDPFIPGADHCEMTKKMIEEILKQAI